MQVHAVANLFPAMSDREFAELVADIDANGLREAVWTKSGAIIDGRHRWKACEQLGRECPTREYEGEDLVAFVVSLNLRRRHLDESQRSLVAGRIAELPVGANQHAQVCAPTQAVAAEMLNVSRRSVQAARVVLDEGAPELVAAVEAGKVSVSAAADVAQLPKPEQVEIVARGEREILEAAKKIRSEKAEQRREQRIDLVFKQTQAPGPIAGVGKFAVIYADPPWRYEHAESESRAIENQYPTMALDEICALPVSDAATNDCVLFMWATSPKLYESMRVLDAWGFTYRTCAVWDKEVIGMGYYFRQQHELLLVATRGEMPAPPPDARPSSVVREKRGQHSAKPALVYELIERMYPSLPKLEVFARGGRDGWAVWGNQARAA